MSYKKFLISIIILCSCVSGYSQSFFNRLPKLKNENVSSKSLSDPTAKTKTYWAFRPVVVSGYSLPDNHVMGGAGFGYQNVTYDYTTERYYANYSINVVGFAGGAIPPKSQGDIISYGVMIGAINNLVMAGACINDRKVQAVISFGINFNN